MTFTTLLSLIVATASAQEWVNESNEHTNVVLKAQSQFVPEGASSLGLTEAAVEDMIRKHDIITLPDRNASIRLATEAESASIPAPFMSPPQLIGNTGQYGEFVLVQKNLALGDDSQMDDWNHDAITWALTVHKARPGHELQFASLVENGTSLARVVNSLCNVPATVPVNRATSRTW